MRTRKRGGLVARQSGHSSPFRAVCISMNIQYSAPRLGHLPTAFSPNLHPPSPGVTRPPISWGLSQALSHPAETPGALERAEWGQLPTLDSCTQDAVCAPTSASPAPRPPGQCPLVAKCLPSGVGQGGWVCTDREEQGAGRVQKRAAGLPQPLGQSGELFGSSQWSRGPWTRTQAESGSPAS